MNVVVVGSSNTDMIIKVEHLPKPGETILGGEFTKAAGGKGANQAVAAARAGGNVNFIAKVGDDIFGETAVKGFVEDKINVESVLVDDKAPSGIAQIFVADDGENCIAVASGANANLSVEDIVKSADKIKQSKILLTQLETPIETVAAAVSIAAKNNLKVIINPAPAAPLSDEILANVSVITPNETEADMLTGVFVSDEMSAADSSDILRSKGVDSVIITMGFKGAFVNNKGDKFFMPGYKVEAVDTTAAGDVFNGALAVALAQDKDFKVAVKFATAAAALSVTKLGAQPSIPTLDEINNFIATHNS